MATDVPGCIRAKIAAGVLPIHVDSPGKLWVGKGGGHSCNGCDQRITETETQ
jgi:hypothetical protein